MHISNPPRFTALLFIALFLSSFVLQAQSQLSKIDSLKQAVNSATTDSDKVKILLTLSKATICADTLHKIAYALDALRLADKTKWDNGRISTNITLGEIYNDCSNNYRLAVKYYKDAETVAETKGDKVKQAELLSRIAYVYKGVAQYSKALEYYRTVLSLKTIPDFDLGALGNMGDAYINIGDYPAALACYDSSLAKLEQSIRTTKNGDISDTMQMAALLSQIGDVYLYMAQYDKALQNYNSILELGNETKNKSIALLAFTGMGKTYTDQDDYVKAIECYNKALEDCRVLNSKREEAEEVEILDQLANVYLNKGIIKEAISNAQEALQLAGKNNFYDKLSIIYNTLGKIYTRLNKNKEAIDYLNKAIGLCKNTGQLDVKQDALKALSNAYEQMKQPALAFDAYRQYITIRDSVYNLAKANEITRIDLQSGYERGKIADSLKQANAYELRMQKQQVYTYGGYAGLAVVALLAFFIYSNYTHEKKANKAISKASEAVKKEKQVSENLLLNILPEEVARELKAKGMVDAKLFDHVTVLFTDFINFTEAAERFTPQELVAELHTCFKAFDGIVSNFNIEKIKTVGDGYVAVSGMPQADPAHAAEMVKAAIEIRNFMEARRSELGNRTFGIRIGINSGTVVAGIVGVKKFAYDIWGDTVNIAARMEQYGMEGRINISQSTYDLVKDGFTCTDRGEVDAKHKGKMRMYFVEA